MTSLTSSRPRSGHDAEAAARQWLEARGLSTVSQNWHSRFGELDLVMHDGTSVVFVEVRLRNDHRFGGGGASVTTAKQAGLWRTASLFLAEHPEWASCPCRFDVIAARSSAGQYQFEWIPNAFYGD